jgi:hypothetical protein
MCAVMRRNEDVVRLILQNKVNIDAQDQKKRTALHRVCWIGTASNDSQFSDEVAHSVQIIVEV